ncbi:MAG TPA: condensation domain-containing protein, partial [Kofleriaceae bacterium]|nr:condensation domain-containing protein [Kofleriaceae bacterium]
MDLPVSYEQRARQFWNQQLESEPAVLELPFDYHRRATSAFTAGWVRRVVPAHGLAAVAARHGVAIETLILAAYCVMLQRYAGQDELVIGLALAGRSDRVPIRVDLAARPVFTALVAEVARLEASARAYADYPVHALLDRLRGSRDPGRPPMFQATFAAHAPGAEPDAPFDLALGATATAGGVELALGHDAQLFARETIERMIDALGFLLEGIAADPDRRVTELPLVTPLERARVVAEFNATARGFAVERRLHDHVADQA